MAVHVSGSGARSMKPPAGFWGSPWPSGEPAAVNGHEWAEFETISSAATGGENWATFANTSIEDRWTTFSSAAKSTLSGHYQHDHHNGIHHGNQQTASGVESDELDWQDFTSSNLKALPHLGSSKNLGGHLDSDFCHLETKARSLSSPLPEHRTMGSQSPIAVVSEQSRRTFSECFCTSCKNESSEVQLTALSRVMDQRYSAHTIGFQHA